MIKALMVVTVMLLLAVPAIAEVGGPCLQAGRFEVGYDLDYINRDYDFTGWTWAAAPTAGVDYDVEAKTVGHYATVAYGFTDQFEGKVYLGGADFDGHDREAAPANLDFDDGTSFSWGIGAKFTQPDVFSNVDLTLGGQYFASNWENVSTTQGGINIDNGGDNNDVDLESRMWNVSLVASTELEQFTPYIGIRYSDDQLDADIIAKTAAGGTSGTRNYEADNNFGGLVGVDVDFTGAIGGNLEVRFGDENVGVAGGINYQF